MNFKLETPIFIEDSFIAPIFNLNFEKELLKILEHLATDIKICYPKDEDIFVRISAYIPDGCDKDDKLIEDLTKTINELIRINHKLLQVHGCDGRDYAARTFLTNENSNRIMQCVRQLQCIIFELPRNSEICIRIERLTRFLIQITSDNALVQRKVRCNQ